MPAQEERLADRLGRQAGAVSTSERTFVGHSLEEGNQTFHDRQSLDLFMTVAALNMSRVEMVDPGKKTRRTYDRIGTVLTKR